MSDDLQIHMRIDQCMDNIVYACVDACEHTQTEKLLVGLEKPHPINGFFQRVPVNREPLAH